MTLATGALGALAAAFIAFLIAWTVSFFVRFWNAPVALYNAEKARADSLSAQIADLQAKMTVFEGWIPIAHAPFDLIDHPKLSKEAKFWTAPLLEQWLAGGHVDQPPTHSEMKWNVSLPQYRDKWGYDLILCKIDFSERRFRWVWGPSEKRGRGFNCAPWFIANCHTFIREGISEDGWQEIVRHANSTWSLMCDPIWELIRAKKLILWARIGSPTAPFSQIPPDSWQHFEVTDWERGQAATGSGERIFSLHVQADGD